MRVFFFFQAEDGIRDAQESRGLGDVYKRQIINPKNDCLGFDVKLPANRNKILYIDTERTIQDLSLIHI